MNTRENNNRQEIDAVKGSSQLSESNGLHAKEEGDHHHHHHHGEQYHVGRNHHHHQDESETFKNENLKAQQRKKFWSKTLFVFLSIIAIAVILFAVWAYQFDD